MYSLIVDGTASWVCDQMVRQPGQKKARKLAVNQPSKELASPVAKACGSCYSCFMLPFDVFLLIQRMFLIMIVDRTVESDLCRCQRQGWCQGEGRFWLQELALAQL